MKQKKYQIISLLISIISILLMVSCMIGGSNLTYRTVSFETYNGTPVADQTVVKGCSVVRPVDPANGGAEFDNWYTEEGDVYDFSFKVISDFTLYARWKNVSPVSIAEEYVQGSELKFSIDSSPAAENLPTVVTIPAEALASVSSGSSELIVATYNIEVSPTAFTITNDEDNNLAVAGINCKLTINGENITNFDDDVIVSTYIPKAISSVKVIYDGTEDQPDAGNGKGISAKTRDANYLENNPTELGYSPTSGLLRFKTNHFSEFYVATNAEVFIVEDEHPTNISAMTFTEFRDSVNNGSNYSGYTVTLLKNIDLSETENWTSISTTDKYDAAFAGIFDGDGHTISNMKTTDGNLNGSLFGSVTGTIRNLTMKDAVVTNGRGVLATLGARSIQIINCHLINCKVITTTSTGLLLGYVDEVDNALIKQCTIDSASSVTSSGGAQTGGIVGQVCSGINNKKITIEECVNNASITGCNSAGGIVGQLGNAVEAAVLKNCTNTGTITLTASTNPKYVGGLVGYRNSGSTTSGTTTLTDCKNTGTVTSTITGASVGGFFGFSNAVDLIFNNCSSTGSVGADSAAHAGGYVACLNGGTATFDKCTVDTSKIGQATNKGYYCGTQNGSVTINTNCSPDSNS